MTVELAAGSARLTVDPADGGRWTSLSVAGHELLTGVDLPEVPAAIASGCFPLAPSAGRTAHGRLDWHGVEHQLPLHAPPHAIHETAVYDGWELVEATGTTAVLTHRLAAPWPFRGVVRQELSLHPDRLEARLEVRAEDEMPVVLGWHPWFRRRLGSSDVRVELSAEQQYEKGDDELPTGELVAPQPGPHDDCFVGVEESPRLRWPGVLELVLESPVDHWVLFDEQPDAVCVEPQTGPPDAVRLGRAAVVPAGGTLDLPFVLRWTTLDQDERQ